ncbi:MAG TPA: ABC transporter permease [Clostridiales bacterium]|nr:ABC transporter permease [Clostridiales bacterium]
MVFLVACLLLLGITIGGLLAAETAVHADLGQKYLNPSLQHLFGTDQLGRDMLARVVKGLSTSILIGLGAASCSAVLAVIFGSAAALLGKKIDAAITWLVDLMLGIPHIVLLILISYALGKGFWGVTIGVALTHWPSLSRVIRGEILQLKETQYVKTARKLGQSPWRIAVKHMLPAVFPQFLVGLILLFPHAILHEASITFLGFGLPPEQPAIGVILAESMKYLSVGMWWLAFFPGVALIGVVALFDLAGGSLRRLIDPHSAQE